MKVESKDLPFVSSEGAPFLLGALKDLARWNGSDIQQFKAACIGDTFSIWEVVWQQHRVVAWDHGGPGTAFLVRQTPSEMSFILTWSEAPLPPGRLTRLAAAPFNTGPTIEFKIQESPFAIMSAAQDGRKMCSGAAYEGVPKGLDVGDAAYVLGVPPGIYLALADHFVEEGNLEVARLSCRRIGD
jgi:hypothetical protein